MLYLLISHWWERHGRRPKREPSCSGRGSANRMIEKAAVTNAAV